MIEARLNGLFPPDFAAAERVNLSRLWEGGERPARPPASLPGIAIADARPLQARAESDAAFFEAHGFALLQAPSRVRDWGDEEAVRGVYMPEVEAMVRERLYPGRGLRLSQPPRVMRRGAGTDNPEYGDGVHSDFGVRAEDFAHNVAAFAGPEAAAQWQAGFAVEGVTGFVMLDFWRTTGMDGPLRHMPLAVCDPASVDPADIVDTALEGIAPGGALTRHIGLRFNRGQRWYHYSGMTGDELLVFKLFELRRGEAPQLFRACFHSAFGDPSAPADAQPRQSCEHRVPVTLLD